MTNFETYRFASQNLDSGDSVAIYGMNPGPTKAIIPIAESLRESGVDVVFRLAEPSKSEVSTYFDGQIVPFVPDCPPSLAFTCGHIDRTSFTADVASLRNENPNLQIVTMDDNLDGTLPLIEQLVSLSMTPSTAFIMNPLSLDYVQDLIAGEQHSRNKAVVTNNPAFDRFYRSDSTSHAEVKMKFREEMGIAQDQQVITFIGFPEKDYLPGYAEYVYDSVATALQPTMQGKTFIYWPHGRGADHLPKQFDCLSKQGNIIYRQRSWWQDHNIGIHKQLVNADIALMTNSTSSAEVFTAWGLQRSPMCIPIDISLVDDYPNLGVNRTLRDYQLVHTLSSREALIEELPQILQEHERWQPHNAANRLAELQWLESPLNSVVNGILKLL